jgi:hypothetical protein
MAVSGGYLVAGWEVVKMQRLSAVVINLQYQLDIQEAVIIKLKDRSADKVLAEMWDAAKPGLRRE